MSRGETLGIIGHNGAGKSTLLKILSRITPPTEGRAVLRGRVGALLEVGTGFHPELTGRENIFLNGAILNMSRAEITRKFDEIVEFADIGPFIDTPVKRYSSGMQMRLAFSVAAHLEPEILIVDEVLSVGDVAFQEKCLGRMEEASREGRTIVFISHNLGSCSASATARCCSRRGGSRRGAGSGRSSTTTSATSVVLRASASPSAAIGRGRPPLHRHLVRERREDRGLPDDRGRLRDRAQLRDLGRAAKERELRRHVRRDGGRHRLAVFNLESEPTGKRFENLPPTGQVRCSIPRFPLPAAQYFIHLWAKADGDAVLDEVHNVLMLTVAGGDFFGSGRLPHPDQRTVLVDQSCGSSDGAGREGVAPPRAPRPRPPARRSRSRAAPAPARQALSSP